MRDAVQGLRSLGMAGLPGVGEGASSAPGFENLLWKKPGAGLKASENHPPAAKAAVISLGLCGTGKSVPLQSCTTIEFFRSL